MIYSCFDQPSGLYRYFEDEKQIPFNGDLPVPSWLAGKATKLGTPSLEAGRPLPRGAKSAGTGHQARGLVVACDGASLSGLGSLPLSTTSKLVGVAALGTAALLWASEQKISSAVIGAFGLAAVLSE